MVVGRDEDDSIGDIEISIAGWKSYTLVSDTPRTRQRDNRKLFSISVCGALQTFKIFPERSVVLILRVLLENAHNRGWIDEPCDIVNVPVGVIANNPLAEPDGLIDVQIVPENLFNLAPPQVGIAICVEKTLLGCEASPAAIHIDRAPFKDNPGVKDRHPEEPGDLLGHRVVLHIGLILPSPSIEYPIVESQAFWMPFFGDEGWTVVTHPYIQSWNLVDGYMVHGGRDTLEPALCLSPSAFVVDKQADLFRGRDGPDHLYPDLLDEL